MADVPWREIVATRNRLVHAYFDINADIVLRAATEDIPSILGVLQQAIGAEG